MNRLLKLVIVLVFLMSGCTKEIPDRPNVNQPPRTFLWLFPDSTIAQGTSRQHIRWWGEDPDGIIKGYLFASGKSFITNGQISSPDTITWRWKTGNDTIIAFPLLIRQDTFQVAVRSVDNTFTVPLPDQAMIRFSPFTYYDQNENGVFDGNDQPLPTLSSATDHKGASLGVPVLNQPPSIVFAQNPNDPNTTLQQPETTYTVATFSWVGSDPDGDKTIVSYRVALNNPTDSTHWVSIPGNISLITLFVPRSRSDSATGEVSAEIYSGKFLNRQLIGSLPGLKLDSLNTFYVQAKDIAGDYSPMIQLPQIGGTWFVRKPKWRTLAIVDYISSDSLAASTTYHNAFLNIGLREPTLANYDDLNIGRGITSSQKQSAAAGESNPRYGNLVPPFIDPAFIYTLFLYDYVFWYTDQYPSIPVAQLSLFPYYNTVFSGHKGKVIFTTSFGTLPDPRGLLRDFAPIDSASSVNLTGGHLLPTLGDTRIPGGANPFKLYPDSSNVDDIFPQLVFNSVPSFHVVSFRPIYRRADARYIYHMQPDTRTPLRYVNLATLSDLFSVVATSSQGWCCGASGLILNTTDSGQTWHIQNTGVQSTLRAIQFLDASTGWCVGDDGAILTTTNGGSTWGNQSVITYEDFAGIYFTSPTIGIAVGTNGLLIRTTNGGTSWSSVRSQSSANLHSVHFIDQTLGLVVGDNGTILKSDDGGVHWRLISSGTTRRLNAVRFIDNVNVIAVGASGTVIRSTDAGESWSIEPALGGELQSVYFSDNLNGWLCGTGGGIYATRDAGASWLNQPSGVGQNLFGTSFENSSAGWCVGSGGIILRTENSGTTWTTQPRGNLNVAVIDGAKSFVFLGLPLHLLNGNGTNVQAFLEHILRQEFAQ
ncbi:MAG: hypothetical protein HYR76_04730 [Ignavibacteria bacterium]|nr:hypothetical protein [Ignavibacteria bacterium]